MLGAYSKKTRGSTSLLRPGPTASMPGAGGGARINPAASSPSATYTPAATSRPGSSLLPGGSRPSLIMPGAGDAYEEEAYEDEEVYDDTFAPAEPAYEDPQDMAPLDDGQGFLARAWAWASQNWKPLGIGGLVLGALWAWGRKR